MAWPVDFTDPTNEALVLVPSKKAQIQDLGKFRSGHLAETDILPGSALICAVEDGKPAISDDGKILFAFEGNANGAENLNRYYEKCLHAAGRLAQRYPSMSYGYANPEDLTVVARYDMLRFVFTEILDQEAMEAWSQEEISSYMPPADMQTPTSDPEVTGPLCNLPMRPIISGTGGVYAWTMVDGTVLTMATPEKALTAWRAGDEGLKEVLERGGMDFSEQILKI